MSAKLTKEPPAWHAEVIGRIRAGFDEIHQQFYSASRRAVWLGIYLHQAKERGKADKSIPHGQFGPWLKNNLPDLSRDTVAVYMTIGRGVLEKAKLSFSKFGKSEFCHDGKLPEKIESLIAGKNQQALFLEFKQAEEIEDGILAPKRGRRKGEGGNSAEHLAAIKAAEEKARIDNLTIEAKDTAKWLLENCDPEGLGKIPDAAFAKFCQSIETAWTFCRDLRTARKSGGAQ